MRVKYSHFSCLRQLDFPSFPLAESEGFEPPVPRNGYTTFRVWLFRPLRQLSLSLYEKARKGNRIFAIMQIFTTKNAKINIKETFLAKTGSKIWICQNKLLTLQPIINSAAFTAKNIHLI